MGFRCWFDVSAKEKVNINEAHGYLVRQMLKNVGLVEKDLFSVYSLNSPDRADDRLITVRLHMENDLCFQCAEVMSSSLFYVYV